MLFCCRKHPLKVVSSRQEASLDAAGSAKEGLLPPEAAWLAVPPSEKRGWGPDPEEPQEWANQEASRLEAFRLEQRL